ncbi:MAG: hypothetical protein JW955_12640 [Sedimentisphaerales bacterium]|nr:hypothetical protein [Sedimentisphaerales bacterium]
MAKIVYGGTLHRTSLDAATLAEYFDVIDEPILSRRDILWPDNPGFSSILSQTLHQAWSEYEVARPGIPGAGGLGTGARWKKEQMPV